MVVSFQVLQDFERARRKAFWRRIAARVLRRDNALLSFEETRRRLGAQLHYDGGLQTVPIDGIVGSVSRYHDFDRAFLPRRTETRNRWLSIDRAYYEDTQLPPVELYQLGEVFFVKDGNHRVSVAREQGQEFIDAYVMRLQTPVPVATFADLEDWVRDEDAVAFHTATRLLALRPDASVELTLCGQYEKLIEHINVHRWFLGTERGACVHWDEAVESWYDQVYMPLVEVIRESRMLSEFPGRTEADLYLWLIEHRWFLSEAGSSAPMDEVVRDYAAAYSPRLIRRLARLIA